MITECSLYSQKFDYYGPGNTTFNLLLYLYCSFGRLNECYIYVYDRIIRFSTTFKKREKVVCMKKRRSEKKGVLFTALQR